MKKQFNCDSPWTFKNWLKLLIYIYELWAYPRLTVVNCDTSDNGRYKNRENSDIYIGLNGLSTYWQY
jgi:hypothetical protein